MDGYYESTGVCIACDSVCKTCTGSSSNCTACLGNTDLAQSPKCTLCGVGYYLKAPTICNSNTY